MVLGLYANYLGVRGGTVLYGEEFSGLFAPADTYGQTFVEWAPFQAAEVGINFIACEQYSSTPDLCDRVRSYLNSLPPLAFEVGHFVVAQNIDQIYQVARIRSEWWDIDPDDPTKDDGAGAQLRVSWAPVYYACSDITEEGIKALGSRGVALTEGYQGFSPYADPMTGFEMSYETRYGTKPTFAECKFYDALLLAAFASSYMEHHPEVGSLNDAIIKICTTDNFTTYVNWLISKGRLYHQSYYSAQGGAQTSQTLASWNYVMNNAEEQFDNKYKASIVTQNYPELKDQYAVLVQGSSGWNDYRHEADVLSIYQMPTHSKTKTRAPCAPTPTERTCARAPSSTI